MILTFGKYADRDTEDVPSSYLRYLIEECDDEDVVAAAEDELRYRDDWNLHFEE